MNITLLEADALLQKVGRPYFLVWAWSKLGHSDIEIRTGLVKMGYLPADKFSEYKSKALSKVAIALSVINEED